MRLFLLLQTSKKDNQTGYDVRLKESTSRFKLYINQDMISCETSCENSIDIEICWLASEKRSYSTYVRDGCQKYKRGLTMLLLWIALVCDV